MDEIGLFPLEIVLLPGERIPLHVFEPRYRELIGECLELDAPFGLVLEDEAGRRDVGTAAAVIEVVERFDDGRLNVIVEGRERFRIEDETDGRSFRTASVEPLADAPGEPTSEEAERCLAAYAALAEAAGAEAAADEPGPEGLAFAIAARVDFGPGVKQELLELRSEAERVRRLTALLGRAREAVRFARTAQERAAGNGRVEPPERPAR